MKGDLISRKAVDEIIGKEILKAFGKYTMNNF